MSFLPVDVNRESVEAVLVAHLNLLQGRQARTISSVAETAR